MLKFAFWASLFLTVLKAIELLIRLTRKPSLDLRLTRDIFFRIGDLGEVLFCNATFLARNGPILICDARAELRKTDQAQKAFPLTMGKVAF
jgi:hypothetical protein